MRIGRAPWTKRKQGAGWINSLRERWIANRTTAWLLWNGAQRRRSPETPPSPPARQTAAGSALWAALPLQLANAGFGGLKGAVQILKGAALFL